MLPSQSVGKDFGKSKGPRPRSDELCASRSPREAVYIRKTHSDKLPPSPPHPPPPATPKQEKASGISMAAGRRMTGGPPVLARARASRMQVQAKVSKEKEQRWAFGQCYRGGEAVEELAVASTWSAHVSAGIRALDVAQLGLGPWFVGLVGIASVVFWAVLDPIQGKGDGEPSRADTGDWRSKDADPSV